MLHWGKVSSLGKWGLSPVYFLVRNPYRIASDRLSPPRVTAITYSRTIDFFESELVLTRNTDWWIARKGCLLYAHDTPSIHDAASLRPFVPFPPSRAGRLVPARIPVQPSFS